MQILKIYDWKYKARKLHGAIGAIRCVGVEFYMEIGMYIRQVYRKSIHKSAFSIEVQVKLVNWFANSSLQKLLAMFFRHLCPWDGWILVHYQFAHFSVHLPKKQVNEQFFYCCVGRR